MNRPNTEMAAIVDTGLAMACSSDAVAYIAQHRAPYRMIAGLLSARANRACDAAAGLMQ